MSEKAKAQGAENMTTTSVSEFLSWGRGHRGGAALAIAFLVTVGAVIGILGMRIAGVGGWRTADAGASVDRGTPGEMAPAAPGEASKPSAKPVVRVRISSERQQLIGVRTAVVAEAAPESSIRTVGILGYDETKVTELHAKAAGWVDKVYADYVGKRVRKGDPLLSVYSPDLVAAQLDYLIAIKTGNGSGKPAQAQSPAQRLDHSLTEASRTRLKLLDLTDAQIENLERTGQPSKTVTIYSPFAGVVIERKTFAGQYITPDMSTVKVGDISTIWAIGQVFEYELPSVKVGQLVEIQFPYRQQQPVMGQVSFVYPDIDPHSRTARVRVAFRNPGVELKPESFVTIVLRTGAGKPQLSVPREAVIDTGERQYVLMALPDGYFEPRDVSVGEPQRDSIPVFAGLNLGDRVVTSAQFLIDSETNLQAAMQSMSMTMPGMKTEGGDMKGMDMGKGGGDDAKGAEMKGMKDGDMKRMDMSPEEMKEMSPPPKAPEKDQK